MCVLSHVQLFMITWTVAHQDPLSMEFSRQEYWSGLPFPTPGDLSDPGNEPASLVSPALAVDCLLLPHLGSPHTRTGASFIPREALVLSLMEQEASATMGDKQDHAKMAWC